jgi:hypothetical protein
VPPAEPLPDFDLYAELGLESRATPEDVSRAYRAAIRRFHPDVAGDTAVNRASRLNVARDWLGDPGRRALYDAVHAPRLRADLPDLDPLGAWPERSHLGQAPPNVAPPIASIALAVVVWMLVIGVGSSYVTVAVFILGLVLLVFFGLLAIAGLFRRP